jgi:predicted lipid-binding transport protein (Tim44 family)
MVGAVVGAMVGGMVIASASEVGGLEGLVTVGFLILPSLVGVVVIEAGTTFPPEVARCTIIAPVAAPNTNVNTGKNRNSFLRLADDSLSTAAEEGLLATVMAGLNVITANLLDGLYRSSVLHLSLN